jgi:UDP-N-acetylmuramate--alanine ligase
MDPDHLDIYGTAEAMYAAYAEFAALCTGKLLVHERVIDRFGGPRAMPYSIDGRRGIKAANVRVEGGVYRFDLVLADRTLSDLTLGMPGRHNVENAVAASAMAIELGVTDDRVRKALAGFQGVRRRFEVRARTATSVFIDDYAHHPVELDACIRSARELHPGRRITGIFQPHLFSRTRDLAAGFAQSLAQLDELILLEIYPAREAPIPGITGAWLLDQVPLSNKTLCTKEALVPLLRTRDVDILLALGAGDIDREVPVIAAMLNDR